MVRAERSEHEVAELKKGRGGLWPLIRWIHKRRPFLTAAIVLGAPAHTLLTDARPMDLLDPASGPRFWVAWGLMLFGVLIRLWGSGNLRKNQEITNTGLYVLVRHPLYLGSLAFFLAYFLTVGDPTVGILLFLLLTLGVYYPTMLSEEEYLTLRFPDQFSRYSPPPRLLPDPRRIGDALETDRFDLRAAYGNLGFRSAWFLVALPIFLALLDRIDRFVG